MDLKKFSVTAAKKKPSLTAFLDKLDHTLPGDLQDIVATADKHVWQEVDCKSCANCCKTMTPTFSAKDITRISKHLGMTSKAFKDKWLYKEKGTGDWMNKSQPCQFLDKKNMCSIYDVRPVDCAEFPHHHKNPFDLYNHMYTENIMHCPATLLLVDKVKKAVERKYEM